jgi:hypothetical protein
MCLTFTEVPLPLASFDSVSADLLPPAGFFLGGILFCALKIKNKLSLQKFVQKFRSH